MFASARVAAAVTPLSSPSLKHVLDLTNTHAHTHGPVGLGIRVQGSPNHMSSTLGGIASAAASTSARTPFWPGSDSGQPATLRRTISRLGTSGNNCNSMMSMPMTPPCAPRLRSTSTFLPLALSPILLTPESPQSHHAEGYFSSHNLDTWEIGDAFDSGSQGMNIRTGLRHRLTDTTNTTLSTVHNTLVNAHPEVERIGLGISGLSIDSFRTSIHSLNDVASARVPNDPDSEDEPSPTKRTSPRFRRSQKMATASKRSSTDFRARAQVDGSSNPGDDSDGYSADSERESGIGPHRRGRMHHRVGPTWSDLRSCMDRVSTPFYAPNGELS